ncbi:hypothetical protein [Thermoflavimicrobium daqui]|uniref:Uncharacterized protein n=1 Tax=Thermoflavimicrobium daqui TaxID=2137476 RepID=A0A364K8N2_9BACL|nr:hypothetical protein [Thermoflavimicrobium daqui]RAL26653.1 hypothetical protein DL897_00975 [Thermoflavimicrobium daqui]
MTPWWKQPLWWKSKEFLWSLFALCLLLVMIICGPLLYLQHLELKKTRDHLNNLQKYVREHESTVKLVDQGLRPPTTEELQALNAKVPTEINVSRVIEALQAKAKASGVKWKDMRFAAKEGDLDQIKNEIKISDLKSVADLKTSLEHYLYHDKKESQKSLAPHLSMIYADVYLDADSTQLKIWFQSIKDLDRMIRIREWDNLILNQDENKIGNTRVRLVLYIYMDSNLKLSPATVGNEKNIPTQSPTRIEIKPKPTQEELMKKMNEQQQKKSGTINQETTNDSKAGN